MKFVRIEPLPTLKNLIECYWFIANDEPDGEPQKVIPDGFTELVFHCKNQFEININGQWQSQAKYLIAGQISKYFYLRDTGPAAMIAVKFKPAAITQLFGIDMHKCTDQTIDIETLDISALNELKQQVLPFLDEETAKQVFDNFFVSLPKPRTGRPIDNAVNLIFEKKGMIKAEEIANEVGLGLRQLERLFKKYIGLSPKYYCRIIKFNYIYELMQKGSTDWAKIIYLSGYYDQSHFIRNFKAFTGEDPSGYAFKEQNMANFFLNK